MERCWISNWVSMMRNLRSSRNIAEWPWFQVTRIPILVSFLLMILQQHQSHQWLVLNVEDPCSHNALVGRFCCLSFQHATPTDRQVYVKAPSDGLPETKQSTAVAPFALLRVLQSAYGLAKVLRLWNLRALQWLDECGMKELNYARATNICVAFQKKCGCLKLHVDLACFQVVTTQSSRPRLDFLGAEFFLWLSTGRMS